MRTFVPSLAAVLLAACHRVPATPPPDQPVVLHIAATNDFHGGLYEAVLKDQEGGAFGGLPWLSATIGAIRAEHPDLLLLDGGDEFQGSWPVNATKGRGSIEAMSLLGVAASAVGNHEFDYGGTPEHPLRGALEAAAAAAPYPLLSANIFQADGSRYAPDNLLPWTLIERSGVKIAVVGLTTTETPTTTLPANVADLTFADPVVAVRALLPEIEASGAQVRILVGHLTGKCAPEAYVRNDDPCTPDGEIGRLLTELPEGTFDAMILGHAHTVLHHRVGDTFLLEDRSGGHLVGRLDLVVGPEGVDADASVVHDPLPIQHAPADPGCSGEPFPAGPLDVGGRSLAPDPEAVALIERLEGEAGSLCDELACASRTLGRERQGESPLGDWMADAMLAAFGGRAEIALQNSGGIRADLPEGKVRRESLQRVMPFDNRLVLVELTGAELRRALRIGASGAHGVLQVAGLSYGFDPAREGGSDLDGDGASAEWERDRLCGVEVGGAVLDDARSYRVATSDFLLAGGDHLGPALSGAEVIEQGPLLREALWSYAEAAEDCIGDGAPGPARIRVGPCD